MTKEELLDQIRTSHRQLVRYLYYFERGQNGAFRPSERLKFSPRELALPGVSGDISARDLVALLNRSRQSLLLWLREGGVHGMQPPGRLEASLDSLDSKMIEEMRRAPMDEIFRSLLETHQQVLKALDGLPAQAFTPEFASMVRASSVVNNDWLKKRLRAWRKQHAGQQSNKALILERIRTERRRLEHNLARLSDQEMVQTGVITPGGQVQAWSVKDVLAHLFDWEQRFLGWYQAGLRGEIPETPAPGLSWSQLDVLNQQIYEKYRGWPLADVNEAFHGSYRQVLSAVENIPEDDLFSVGRFAWTQEANLAGYILANTANHYRWAKTLIRKWIKSQG